MTRSALLLITALLAFTVLSACSKVTAENYDRLELGMSYAEVESILGTPAGCDDILTARNCTWGDTSGSINVSFVGGKVVLFSAQNLR